MTLSKTILLSGLVLIGATLVSRAQPQYPSYPQAAPYPQYPQYQQILVQPASQSPVTPPSWSYDPYASGLGPCTQKGPLDLGKCADQIAPTYGQPSYGHPIYPPDSR